MCARLDLSLKITPFLRNQLVIVGSMSCRAVLKGELRKESKRHLRAIAWMNSFQRGAQHCRVTIAAREYRLLAHPCPAAVIKKLQPDCPMSSMAAVATSRESSNQVLSSEHATQTQPSTRPATCTGVVDIGDIYQSCPSDFFAAMNSLTSSQKYNLLTNHRKPHEHHQFPTTYIGGCNRSFRHVWLKKHLWMVYSEVLDGVFCIYCVLFSLETPRGKFVSQPFQLWNKKGEKAKEHERCAYHKCAMDKAALFKHSIENPESTITAKIDSRKAENIVKNRAVLMCIASAALYCGRQCIALGRCGRWQITGKSWEFACFVEAFSTTQ